MAWELRDHSLVFHALEPSMCVMRVGSGSKGGLDVCDSVRARREGMRVCDGARARRRGEGLSVSPTTYRRRSGVKAYQGLRVCR